MPMPTVVACHNDLMAPGIICMLQELGLRVPNDASVMGFDDLKFLHYTPWSLSTVHVPKETMEEKAAEILIRNIEAEQPELIEKVQLAFELILRATTKSLLQTA